MGHEYPPRDDDWPRTWGDVGVNEAGAVEEDIGIYDDVELTPEQRAYYKDLMEEDCPYE